MTTTTASLVPYWLMTTVSPRAVVAYLALTAYANDPEGIRPPVKRIAADMDVSVPQAERALRELREARVIRVYQCWGDNQRLPSRYELAFDEPFGEVTSTPVRTGNRIETEMRKSRAPIAKTVKNAVRERDGDKCRYCGIQCDDAFIHFDHVIPYSKGGQSTTENLVVSCPPCNTAKRNDQWEPTGL